MERGTRGGATVGRALLDSLPGFEQSIASLLAATGAGAKEDEDDEPPQGRRGQGAPRKQPAASGGSAQEIARLKAEIKSLASNLAAASGRVKGVTKKKPAATEDGDDEPPAKRISKNRKK